ncbi:hypothetical protein UMZ34_12930 [Halopseudomonas pachastrellae]|nr:hypothetical protein UMZ34_12930 [Halopseudomonas pachastrellae]
MFGQLAFVGGMQVEELAPRMRHATDFGDALLEASLVACEVIADQFAIPGVQEVTRMFASTAGTEVIDYRLQC